MILRKKNSLIEKTKKKVNDSQDSNITDKKD